MVIFFFIIYCDLLKVIPFKQHCTISRQLNLWKKPYGFVSGLSTLLWCKGYINLSPSNSGFFKISRHWGFFFHLQLRLLHLPRIYMQNQSLCTRDRSKREGFRRSLENVWWQFCSVTAPPSTKPTLQPWGTTVPRQYYSRTCNSVPTSLQQEEEEEWDRGVAVPQWDGAGAYYTTKNHPAVPHRDMTLLLQTAWKHLLSWLSLFFFAFSLCAFLYRHTQNCKPQKVLAKWNFTTELQEGKGK